ncbi:MAG TPA: DUF4199 domain-containing protein [Caulobacter sp.]|nr:DUF4199 domain-containing protein [Caulobacter sp.]
MLRTILIFGLAAGLVVAVPMNLMMIFGKEGDGSHSLVTGYALMLLAFTFTFVGVKHHRDRALGGVIRFLPALLVGLGISVVASVIYVIAWEITLHATNFAFIDDYSRAMLEGARAKGASAAELARMTAETETFRTQYASPLFRLPMTFIEIFPVGVVVSLVTAGLLRNSRFLPMKVVRS